MSHIKYIKRRKDKAYETLDKTIDILEDLKELSYNFDIDYFDEIIFHFSNMLETIKDKENSKSHQLDIIRLECKNIKEWAELLEVRKI